MTDSLEARLTISPSEVLRREDILAKGTLVNTGSETVVLNLAPLGAPSLALEIMDAAGSPVRLPPPPVPGGAARMAQLAAGQSYTVEYPAFVPQWISLGTYRARLRYIYRPSTPTRGEWAGVAVSEWVEFKILQ